MEDRPFDKIRRALGNNKKYTREDLDEKYYPLLDSLFDSCELADCFGKKKKKQLYDNTGLYSSRHGSQPAYDDYYFGKYFRISETDVTKHTIFLEKLNFLTFNDLSKHKIRKIGTAFRFKPGQAEIYLSCFAFVQDSCFEKLIIEFINYCKHVEDVELHGIKRFDGLVNKLLQNIKTKNTLKETQSTIDQPCLEEPRASENIYYFSNRKVKFLGRNKELNRLKSFLNCKMNFSWFQLAGQGGQGKSRIAYELMIYAKSKGWKAGFLRKRYAKAFAEKWNSWQPDKPHLIIVDYVLGFEDEIRNIFENLLLQKQHFKKNIRLLLLERQRFDRGRLAYNSHIAASDNNSLSQKNNRFATWYLKITKEHDLDLNLLDYSFENGVEDLSQLSYDDIYSIVIQVANFERRSADSLDEAFDNYHRQQIRKIDRPLYAYFHGLLLAVGPKNFVKTREELLNEILFREYAKRWWTQFREKAPKLIEDTIPLRITVLSTILGNIDCIKAYKDGAIKNINEEILRKASIISDSPIDDDGIAIERIVTAIKPDLLGEWFVLISLEGGLPTSEIMDIAYKLDPKSTLSFLLRLTMDFPSKEIVRKMIAHDHPNRHLKEFNDMSGKLHAFLWACAI